MFYHFGHLTLQSQGMFLRYMQIGYVLLFLVSLTEKDMKIFRDTRIIPSYINEIVFKVVELFQ